MLFNGPPNGAKFTLDKEILEIVDTHKYLGITLTSKYVTNLYRKHFEYITEKARTKSAIISRHGFHEDGLRWQTAIKLYKLVIRPTLEYCAQTLSYSRYSQSSPLEHPSGFAKDLEHLQTQILKNLINCPRSTSPSVVRLFCGVEPLACRLEMLKLRYFWKTLKTPAGLVTSKILKHRMDNFLEHNKGFAHEAFNICCKYNVLHLWHGNAANHKNPLLAIRRIIIAQNLRKDFEIGRTKKCSFAKIFLSDPNFHQKNYQLPETFRQPDCFETPIERKKVVKAILHPCSYEQNCDLCDDSYKDKFHHFLTSCPRLTGYRKELYLRLTFYSFPKDLFPMNKTQFLERVLGHKKWRCCLAKFLTDTDF